MTKKALVVLSGGQDSVTCLALAVHKYEEVGCISFNYNQKHDVELKCAIEACAKYNIKDHLVMEVGAFNTFNDSALLHGNEQSVSSDHNNKPGLPASYVPNRNAMFLTLAHAYAQKKGYEVIITGVCQTDYSGYPDCRAEFIDSIAKALNIGSESMSPCLITYFK